jgi:transcriptional regulator GlxA family with amidase domain
VSKTRAVAILALPGVQLLDVSGPMDVFAEANVQTRRGSEIGVTPAFWVEAARIAAARRMLESGRDAPKQVAARCGFANADTLRRAFVRHVGVTPAEYRRSYEPSQPP